MRCRVYLVFCSIRSLSTTEGYSARKLSSVPLQNSWRVCRIDFDEYVTDYPCTETIYAKVSHLKGSSICAGRELKEH